MKRFIIILSVIGLFIFGLYLFSSKSDEVGNNKSAAQKTTLEQVNVNISKGALLIDVRTADEFADEHAVGSINLPLDDIKLGKMPNISKDSIIYVYCHSGVRASQAKTILGNEGYKNVDSLTSLYNWVSIGGKTLGSNPACAINNKSGC